MDKNIYMGLKYDLSGSRAKNRFRNELLWGLEKILEIYKMENNFTMVFDYVCDIEVHTDDSLEFYQVKTHNTASACTLASILKRKKLKDSTLGDSILGKLYYLKLNAENILVHLVSNSPLKDCENKLHSTVEKKKINDLGEKSLDLIHSKLVEELQLESINSENVFYIYTSMDLFNPTERLLGKIALFFEEVKGQEPKKLNTLFRLLMSEINEKANYELEISSYEEILNKKGISRENFDHILNRYDEKINEAVKKTKEYIETNYRDNYFEGTKMKKALSYVVTGLLSSHILKSIEIEIKDFILMNIERFTLKFCDLVDSLYNEFNLNFPPEYSEYDKKVLIILILIKYEEGIYEQSIN